MLSFAAAALGLQNGLAPTGTQLRASKVQMSRFTGQIWDLDAKQAILEEWDPEAPRGYDNFNPFERDDQGNACDTNGKFPGETAYMDPQRPDMNYMKMLAEKKIIEEILEQPKTQIRGKAGNWKSGWDEGLGMVPDGSPTEPPECVESD